MRPSSRDRLSLERAICGLWPRAGQEEKRDYNPLAVAVSSENNAHTVRPSCSGESRVKFCPKSEVDF
jgi:hypothetical protein